MASTHGIQIRTTNGLEPVENFFSAQVVYQEVKTSQSGSNFCPGGVTINNAVGICLPLDNKIPLGSVSISNNSVSWARDSTFPATHLFTSNFIIRVYRVY